MACATCGSKTHQACILEDAFGPGCDLSGFVGHEIVVSGTTNKSTNGRYKIISKRANGKVANFSRAYGMSMGTAVPWNPRPPPTDALMAAKILLRNPLVRLHGARANIRNGKKKRCVPFRVLDHGDNWQDQNCGIRFKVVRWLGPTPSEWEKVGWRLGNQGYDSRRNARTDAEALNIAALVMEC